MTRHHTPQRLTLDAILPYLRTKCVSKRNDGGRQVLAYCPAHDDRNHPSLSLTKKADGTLLWRCFAGCSQDAVREALERLAGVQPATARPIVPCRNAERQSATPQAQPLMLATLANAKGLDAERLRAWGLTDLQGGGVEIPYRNADGKQHAVRYRLALEGANRFRWRQGDTPICMVCGNCPNGATPTQSTCVRAKAILGRCGTRSCLRWGFRARACGNPSGGARWRRSTESC